MASFLSRLTAPFRAAGAYLKSFGERQWAKLLGTWGFGSYGTHWASNRQELVGHFKGWNYVGIRCICEEIAGMTPQLAYRRDGQEVAGAKRKAFASGGAEAVRAVQAKYLNQWQRKKALAPVQQDEELEPVEPDHDLVRLMRDPNRPDVPWTFWYKVAMYLELTGEAYIWLVPNKIPSANGEGKQPAEFWVLPSHWVWPKADEDGDEIIGEYEIKPMAGYVASDTGGIGWFPGFTGKFSIPADQVVMLTYPNPTGFFSGYAPLAAISDWVDCSDNVDRSRTAQFQNGAFPGVVIEIDKAVADPKPEVIDRLKERLASAYVGVRRRGTPIVLVPGVTMKPLDHTPVEMDYVSSGDQLKNWVLAAHRVGQSIAGLVENTTFSNAAGAKANFHSLTIRTKLIYLGQVCTEKIARRFDKDLVWYWPESVPDDVDFLLREDQAMLDRDAYTINEVRARRGMEPVSWGDKPLTQVKSDHSIPGGIHDNTIAARSAGSARAAMEIAQLQRDHQSGKVDRDSAVAHMMLIFGLSQSEAESLFPENLDPPPERPDGSSPLTDAQQAGPGGSPEDSPEGGGAQRQELSDALSQTTAGNGRPKRLAGPRDGLSAALAGRLSSLTRDG